MNDKELSPANMDQLLKTISIPPRPAVLIDLQEEFKKDEPDLKKIAHLVGKDVGLSAAVLKVMNSSLFAMRTKVGSINQAVQLLGAKNITNIVTGLLLRNSLDLSLPGLESFWNSAERVASINAYLCSVLRGAPKEEAYSLGLFRNCGMLLLMRRYDDYQQILKVVATEDAVLHDLEFARYRTDHMAVGRLTAMSWGLSVAICQAIQHHHSLHLIEERDRLEQKAKFLIAVNFLGERINNSTRRASHELEWSTYGMAALDYIGLSLAQFENIETELTSSTL